jgi:hypothetical protein
MNNLFEDIELLKKVFSSSPQAMVLFDSLGTMIFNNKVADSLAGDIRHAPFKESAKEVIAANSSYTKRLTYKYMDEDREKEISVFIKGSVIEYKGDKYALLTIQDTAEIMQAVGMINICSNCKKIKRSESSWQDIEAYIKENLANIQFSHCICPDCSKKLYTNK